MGIGGTLIPCTCAKIHLTEKTSTRRFQDTDEHSGGARKGHIGDGGTRDEKTHKGMTGTWEQLPGEQRFAPEEGVGRGYKHR